MLRAKTEQQLCNRMWCHKSVDHRYTRQVPGATRRYWSRGPPRPGNNASVNSSCAHSPPPPPASPPWATAEHLPALSVPERGICKFCAARGQAYVNHRASPANFWQARGFLSEYTYTEDFNGKTSRLAHLSRRRKYCKGMFSIWCMHLFIAY